MPKVKHCLKLVAYDAQNNYIGEHHIKGNTFDSIFQEYLGFLELLTESQFSCVRRLDLVGGNHILFVFCDVRQIINQHNLTIKLNDYD